MSLRSGQPRGLLQLPPLRAPGAVGRGPPGSGPPGCGDAGPGGPDHPGAHALPDAGTSPGAPSGGLPAPDRARPGGTTLAPSAKPLVLGLVAAAVVVLVIAAGGFAVRRLTATDKKKAPPGTAANPAAPAFDSLEEVVLQLQGFVERHAG